MHLLLATQPPQGILMVKDLCKLINDNLSDLWNLGQSYLSNQLGDKVFLYIIFLFLFFFMILVFHLANALQHSRIMKVTENKYIRKYFSIAGGQLSFPFKITISMRF